MTNLGIENFSSELKAPFVTFTDTSEQAFVRDHANRIVGLTVEINGDKYTLPLVPRNA